MRRFPKILFLLVIFFLWNVSLADDQFFEAGVQKLEVPVNAPNFRLEKLGGGKISLKAFRGKIILLNFFAPWCEVCQKGSSSFEKLAEEYKLKGIAFFLVAIQAKEKDLREFKEEFHVSSPILIDKDGSVVKAYRVFGHHEIFFINREGKIVGKKFAPGDWTSASMRNLIEHLLAENK